MTPVPAPAPTPARLGKRRLFSLFAGMAMVGFGGVMPWMHRILVEKHKIVTAGEFLEILAFAQLLPGPTVCNLALIVGYRRGGVGGAVATLAGMTVPPCVIVVVLAALHRHYQDAALVKDALRGMAVASAALVAAMAVRVALALPPTARNVVFAAAMFVGIALLRWPLPLVMLGLAALALASQIGKKRS